MNDAVLRRRQPGVAPSAPGQAVGEVANVYDTAEYFFYRAQ